MRFERRPTDHPSQHLDGKFTNNLPFLQEQNALGCICCKFCHIFCKFCHSPAPQYFSSPHKNPPFHRGNGGASFCAQHLSFEHRTKFRELNEGALLCALLFVHPLRDALAGGSRGQVPVPHFNRRNNNRSLICFEQFTESCD